MHGAPVPLFFPPFPNEEKMRRGRLNVEKPLGGLGESHSVKREQSCDLTAISLVTLSCSTLTVAKTTPTSDARPPWDEPLPT